jgi:hypothetical protein
MSKIKEHIHSNEEDMVEEYELQCYYEEMKEKYGEENIKDLLDFFSPLMEVE